MQSVIFHVFILTKVGTVNFNMLKNNGISQQTFHVLICLK